MWLDQRIAPGATAQPPKLVSPVAAPGPARCETPHGHRACAAATQAGLVSELGIALRTIAVDSRARRER